MYHAHRKRGTSMSKFRFEHIHLRSPDVEATAQFYERMFGAEIVRGAWPDGRPRVDLKLGGIDIFIMAVTPGDGVHPAPSHPHQGLDHFGMLVDDIDTVVAELKAKGVKFTMEPKTIRPGVRVAFLQAPDAVSIELLDRNAKI